MASAARTAAKSDSEDSESDDGITYDRSQRDIGNLDLVQKTLQGIVSHEEDEKQDCFRIHAASINLGRSLWQSPELTAEETSNITCQSETYPVSADEAKAAVQQLMKNQNIERTAPFRGQDSANI